MTIDDVKQIRERASTLLIILVTSGLGGLLGVITTLKEPKIESLEIGPMTALVISVALILSGCIVYLYYNHKAKTIIKSWKSSK